VGLGVEALEDRLVPTVIFEHHFVGTEVTSGPKANQYSLQSEPVVLIFGGSYWQTARGQRDEQTLVNSVKTILAGPYLSGLTQYGSNGRASLFATATTGTPLALQYGNYPDYSDVLKYVNGQLAVNPGLVPPASANPQQKPLYVVFNDPNSSGPGGDSVGSNGVAGGLHLAYVGTKFQNGSLWLDNITWTFSHELAEATASAIAVNDPGHFNADSQICDNEPEIGAGYLARVNGVEVQAYWSQQDQAFIVPDGKATNTVLTPIWTDRSFTGYCSDATATAPRPGTGVAAVGRVNTFVITRDGALWEHTGSDYSTGWIQLVNRGVTAVQVGIDALGADTAFVQIGGDLLEHRGTDPSRGWTFVDSGVTAFSASQVQANTVFTSYGSDLWEYANGNWTKLKSRGVTGFQAGLGGDGRASVFANFGGDLREYSAGTWYAVDNGVTAFSASQVQADTVFTSYGGDLWQHVGTDRTTGWTQLATSSVTAFSAGEAAPGRASVFALIYGDLREHTGTDPQRGWHEVQNGGVTSFSASQFEADAVFVFLGSALEEHTGRGSGESWQPIL
jgi:hypothetical protein